METYMRNVKKGDVIVTFFHLLIRAYGFIRLSRQEPFCPCEAAKAQIRKGLQTICGNIEYSWRF